MEQLLLVNPRRRRRRNSRRRMPAGLRRYWAKHRRGRHRVHLANPRRRHRRRNSRSLFMARRRRRRNPRVHGYMRRRAHHRMRNPRRRRYAHHRRHLRNPRRGGGGFGMRGLMRNAVMPAMLGGTGALMLDVVDGYVSPYLPVALQAGYMRLIMKGVGAVAIGMAASRFLGRERGRVVMLGALTVVAYSALRTAVAGAGIPGLSGLGYGDYTPFPMHGFGAYMRGPTGTPGIQGFGYVSPAAVVGPTMSPRMGAYMPMNVVPAMGDYGDGM